MQNLYCNFSIKITHIDFNTYAALSFISRYTSQQKFKWIFHNNQFYDEYYSHSPKNTFFSVGKRLLFSLHEPFSVQLL